jgi:hypothetical protein
MLDTTDIRLVVEQLKQKTENNTKNIELVFQYLDELLQKQTEPKTQIGYKTI